MGFEILYITCEASFLNSIVNLAAGHFLQEDSFKLAARVDLFFEAPRSSVTWAKQLGRWPKCQLVADGCHDLRMVSDGHGGFAFQCRPE